MSPRKEAIPLSSELSGNELAQQNRTLYVIADDLSAYFETREMLTAQLAEPQETPADTERLRAELAEVDASIEKLCADLATKVDSCAGVLRRMDTEIEELKEEQERIHARRKTYESAKEKLRKYVANVMIEQGLPNLKSVKNTLYLQSHAAVAVLDAAEVPDAYKSVMVKMSMPVWHDLNALAERCGVDPFGEDIRVEVTISLSAIKKAIKAGEEVPGADLEFKESLCLR
jgi:FtsZ-binding cell division protein ZapB